MKQLLIAFLTFACIAAQAQTADEIIQKYSAAMGGLEKFNKLKSAKLTGSVSTQGMDLPITIQIINGKAVRSDIEVMGQAVISSYKDGKGWKINPFQGAATATEVTGAELNEMKTQSFITSQLMDYKARGYKAELLGQENVEGVNTYKIKLTTEDNKSTTYYIDATNSLIVKSVTKRDMMGQEVEVETIYKDVKEFDGVKFTMTRIQKADGQVFQEVHIDKVELNTPIDEKVFDK